MEDKKPEFFKLETIDRKVLFWIMENSSRGLTSWIEYIAREYREKKSISIDGDCLLKEVEGLLSQESSMVK